MPLEAEADSEKVDSPVSGAGLGENGLASPADEVVSQLEDIIGRLFVVSNSKNVLQVGLSALVQLLHDFDRLQPMFIDVLLAQPQPLRRRLLTPPLAPLAPDGEAPSAAKLTYVWGSSTREYEEKNIAKEWPHLDMAKTFVKKHETSPLGRWEIQHMEVFLACLPEVFVEDDGPEWLALFEKVKEYIFVALVDPDLHLLSTLIIKKFWLCNVENVATESVGNSANILLQALKLLYSTMDRAKVDEQNMIDFLKDIRSRGGDVAFEVDSVIETFQDNQRELYDNSKLYTVMQ
jgi:hypothetical protein